MGENNPDTPSNRPTLETTGLQQILAISTSLTNENERDEIQPVDEERRTFFFDSLQNIIGMKGNYQDDIEVIKVSLEELRTNPNDVNRCSIALQNIMDLVDHIDVASDFMKLGGFGIISTFLTSENTELVRLAAEIIGISCQNHPRCQKAIFEDPKIFEDLFTILRSQQNDTVKMKAVFAISSSIQNNKQGHDKFVQMNGYDSFLHILRTASIPLRLRTCFVIDCLCSQFPQIRSMLLEKQLVNSFVELLSKIPIGESKETVINAMLTFVEGFYDAINECNKKEHNLKATLDYLIAHYTEDFKEEKEKAIKLKEELNRFTDQK